MASLAAEYGLEPMIDTGAARGQPAAGGLATAALPCLIHHKCIRDGTVVGAKRRVSLSHSGRQIKESIVQMAKRYGLHRIGVLTLGFKTPLPTNRAEMQKRIHSLVTNVLNPRYLLGVMVLERSDGNYLHLHVVVVTRGSESLYVTPRGIVVNGAAVHASVSYHDWSRVPASLRKEWAFWRAVAPKYGFFRPEFLPPKGKPEWVGRYLGKYLAKGSKPIFVGEKCRRVRWFGTDPFNLAKGGARMHVDAYTSLWRAKLKMWAEYHGCKTHGEMVCKFGSHWYWKHKHEINEFGAVFIGKASAADVLSLPDKSPRLKRAYKPKKIRASRKQKLSKNCPF